VKALNRSKSWDFQPVKGMKVGDHVTGGDIIGSVNESILVKHSIMVPPNACGTIKYIAPKGSYSVTVCCY
jgi:V-type H+-transporting ATPase subunit A